MDVRCVIVDDNDHFLEVARNALERDGITVVGVASNSSEAKERINELRPDVTLIDISLGEESGFDLVEEIAQANGDHRPELILISTYTERDFLEIIASSPASAFISKSDLCGGAIRDVLGGAGPSA